jgi:galactose mutarotase-like enzyme
MSAEDMSAEDRVRIAGPKVQAVIERRGAQLRSLRVGERELIWQGAPGFWPESAPILFPLIARIPDDRIRLASGSYPMPPHGLVLARTFDVAEQSATRCVFETGADDETRRSYPFDFRLRVSFDAAGDGLAMAIEVRNEGAEPMPCDVGYHVGFRWPLEDARSKDDCIVRFEHAEPAPIRRGTGDPIMLTHEPRPTPVEGDLLRPRDDLFEEFAIVWDRLESRALWYGAQGGLGVRLDFPDSPNLGIWMQPGGDFLCLEPWQGYPAPLDYTGLFADKPGIATVAPASTRTWRLTVTPDG